MFGLHIYQGYLRLSVRTRCGFLKSKILRSGSVRFSEIRNPTVRFRAVIRYSKSYGPARCCDKSYDAVRRGSLLNGFCYGAGPTPVRRENRTKPFFLYGAPYE